MLGKESVTRVHGLRTGADRGTDDRTDVQIALPGRRRTDADGDVGLGDVARIDDDAAVMAARLYAALREFDAAGVDEILARLPLAGDGLSDAVADRLRRAAAGRIVHRTEKRRAVCVKMFEDGRLSRTLIHKRIVRLKPDATEGLRIVRLKPEATGGLRSVRL